MDLLKNLLDDGDVEFTERTFLTDIGLSDLRADPFVSMDLYLIIMN